MPDRDDGSSDAGAASGGPGKGSGRRGSAPDAPGTEPWREGGLVRGRHETPEERADRRWTELVQEIRVAQTGVQILFGFLLTVVFTPRFVDLSGADRRLYITTIVLAAAATGALIGPVSFHRVVAGRRIKPQTVQWASRLTFLGLVLLLATMISALLLVLRVATDDGFVPWLVAGVAAWYLLAWFVLPLWARHRYTTRA